MNVEDNGGTFEEELGKERNRHLSEKFGKQESPTKDTKVAD